MNLSNKVHKKFGKIDLKNYIQNFINSHKKPLNDGLQFRLNRYKSPPVILAKVSHLIPFRTRKLSPLAPMVLCLKTRKSRTLPALNYEN